MAEYLALLTRPGGGWLFRERLHFILATLGKFGSVEVRE
jgi:hypothetical protein